MFLKRQETVVKILARSNQFFAPALKDEMLHRDMQYLLVHCLYRLKSNRSRRDLQYLLIHCLSR